MRIEECKKLEYGDKVLVCIGRNEYQTMTFHKLYDVISYGKTTIDQFLRNGFTGKGRHETDAELEYITDTGRKDVGYFSVRKIIQKVGK